MMRKSAAPTIRTYVQRCTNAHFIFSGSQRHMMNGMFTSPSRPFYQAVSIMNLQPLDLRVYTDFCADKFEQAGKHLDSDVVPSLYQRFDAVTSYMHRILNVLSLYYQMPEKQRMVFLAIAKEGKAAAVTGGQFIKKHKLISASSVSSALKGLLEKDFITLENCSKSLPEKRNC